jgi:hypothetical protein
MGRFMMELYMPEEEQEDLTNELGKVFQRAWNKLAESADEQAVELRKRAKRLNLAGQIFRANAEGEIPWPVDNSADFNESEERWVAAFREEYGR